MRATYYPGTPSPADAQRVTVAVGQELGSIDIALQPVKLAKITGTAMGSDGKPMAGAMVMLMPAMKRRDAVHAGRHVAHHKRRPVHAVERRARRVLAAGAVDGRDVHRHGRQRWCSRWRPMVRRLPRHRRRVRKREFAVATVTVAGEDITGVVVVTTRGAHGPSDDLVFRRRREAGQPDERPRDGAARPTPTARRCPAFGNATVKENGTFEIAGLVGVRVLRPLNAAEGMAPEERPGQRRRRHRHGDRVQAGRGRRRGSRSS